MLKKMYPNRLLKDAINSRSIRTTYIRFSHDPSSNDENNDKTRGSKSVDKTDDVNDQLPSPPTNCCMSGCANCVYLQYAEELTSKLRNGSDVARNIIMKEVQDPNMRSFLEMELRMLKPKQTK